MIEKQAKKEKAILLRKGGKTYSEILKVVPVAKSTISLWLQDVGLSKKQKQTITAKKLASAKRGGEAKRRQRIEKQTALWNKAKTDIKKISKRDLFLIGTVLYWAEGAKEKSVHPGSSLKFSNMDPKMISVFLRWLQDILLIPSEAIRFEITLHETHSHRVAEVKKYWIHHTGFSIEHFKFVYFKRANIKTKRKNVTEETYFGVLCIRVKSSSDYVRKLAGWAEGIYDALQ